MEKPTQKKETKKTTVKKPTATKKIAKKAVEEKPVDAPVATEKKPKVLKEKKATVKKTVAKKQPTVKKPVVVEEKKQEELVATTSEPTLVKPEPAKKEAKVKKTVKKTKGAKPKAKKVAKKVVVKKDIVAKKTTTKTTKPKVSKTTKPTNNVELPKFNDVNDMKTFCVLSGLNKLEGYIPASKLKQTLFQEWIEINKNFAMLPSGQGLTDNPHSPHAGIGDLQPTTANPNPSDKAPIYGEVKIDTPPLKTSDNTNEFPTALTGMNEAMNFGNGHQQAAPIQLERGKGNPELNAYAVSILQNINESFSVKFHGAFDRQEYNRMIANLDKRYTYETKQEGGTFLIIKDDYDNQVRVPETGFLPM